MGIISVAAQRFLDPGAQADKSRTGPGASEAARTVSAPFPRPASSHPPSTSPSLEMPKDEVEVQRDSSTNGEIVIRYVNGSGNLILQVPTAEVLSLARAIDSSLEQQAKDRANPDSPPVVSQGGKTHGN